MIRYSTFLTVTTQLLVFSENILEWILGLTMGLLLGNFKFLTVETTEYSGFCSLIRNMHYLLLVCYSRHAGEMAVTGRP